MQRLGWFLFGAFRSLLSRQPELAFSCSNPTGSAPTNSLAQSKPGSRARFDRPPFRAMPASARILSPTRLKSKPRRARHWADHCAGCHANDGSGESLMGKRTYPPAPDMRLAATQQMTDGELFYIIQNGNPF